MYRRKGINAGIRCCRAARRVLSAVLPLALGLLLNAAPPLSAFNTLYLQDASASVAPGADDYRQLVYSPGVGLVAYTKATANSLPTPPTTATQFTKTAGGSVVTWYSRPVDAVTISGNVTFNLWAYVDNTKANAYITAELLLAAPDGTITGQPIAAVYTGNPKLGTTAALQSWSVTPLLTAVANGQRLAVRLHIGAAGPMRAGYYVYADINGPTVGADGDAWVQTTEALAPARPSTGAVAAAETSLTPSWGLVDGATGYTLTAALDAGMGTVVSSFDSAGPSAAVSPLNPDTTYYLFARTNGSGASSSWAAWPAAVTLAYAPGAGYFDGLAASSMRFNWTANGNHSGTLYRVYVSTAPDPLAPAGAAVTSSDTYNTYLSTSGLSPDSACYFRVAAVNYSGVLTSFTAAQSTHTLAAVPVSANFTGVTDVGMNFNWSASGNPSGTLYNVLVSTAPDPLSPVGAAVTQHGVYGLSLSTSSLSLNTTYYFRAAAVNADGVASAFSAAAATSTLADTPASGMITGAGPYSMRFSFTDPVNPAGTLYRVKVSTASDPLSPGGAAVTSSDTYSLSLSSSGLVPDTAYYFRAAAVNNDGVESQYAPAQTLHTLLAYAPAFTSFTGVSEAGIQFNFSPNGDVYPGTLFRVAVSTAPDPVNPGTASATSSDTYNSYLSSAGLFGNTTYYFRSAGVNKDGVPTAYSAAAATSTLAAVPSGLDFISVSSDSIRMDWAQTNGPGTLYTVLASTAADPLNPAGAAVSSRDTYNLYVTTSGLTQNVSYSFVVRALNNGGGYSAWSAAASTPTLQAGFLAAPVAMSLTPYISSMTANWLLVGGATGYTLAASQNPGAEPSPIAASSDTAVVLSASVSGLSPDTKYYLFVRANGPGSSSAWSDYPSAATLLAYPPASPSVGGVSTSQISFSWSANGDAYPGTLFRVISSTAPDPLNPGGAVVSSSDTYGVSLTSASLIPNTPYYFTTAGINKDGAATAWTVPSGTYTLAAQPVFSGFANLSANSADFSFSANGNPSGTLYRVVSSTAPDPLNPGGAVSSSSDTYSLVLSSSGLSPNTTYYFAAAAVTGGGTATAYSAPQATATLAAMPLSPAAAAVWASSASLAWSADGNPAGTLYRVLLSTAPNPLTPQGAQVASSDTYSLALAASALSPDTLYYFRVAATGRSGDLTPFTAAQQFRTLAYTPLFSSFGVSASSLTLNWLPNGNNSPGLYRVLASTAPDPLSSGGAAVSSSDVYGLSFSTSGLYADTTYYFRLSGENSDGVLSAYTAPAATSTLLAYPPAFSAFTDLQTDSLRFVWTANGNPDGAMYRVLVSTAPDPLNPAGAVVSSSDTYNLSLTTSGLVADTQYYFTAAGVNNNGVATSYMAEQSTRTLQAVTKLFLLDSTSTANPDTNEERVLSTLRGSAPVTYTKATAGNVTPPSSTSQFTKVANGPTETWYTGPLAAVSVSGNVTFNLYAWESATNVNSGITAELLRADGAGNILSTIAAVQTGVAELGIAEAAQTWTTAAANTSLVNGDRLAVRVHIEPAGGNLASGKSVYMTLGGAAAGTSGDTWVQLLQTLLPASPSTSAVANVGASQLGASWGLVNETTGYTLAASVNPENPPLPVYASSSTLGDLSATLSVPALSPNTTYYLFVRSSREGVSSPWAAYPGTSTLLAYPPAASGFAGVGSGAMQFNWSANGDAYPGTLFSVLSSTAPDPLSPGGAAVVSSYTYSLSLTSLGLSPDTTYYFRVAGLNNNNVPTSYTAALGTATLLAYPPLSSGFTGISQTSVQFNWSSNGDAYPGTLFKVVSSTAPDPLNPGGAVAVSSYTYNLFLSSVGLAANTAYYFRVAGVNKNGIATSYTAAAGTATLTYQPAFAGFSAVTAGSILFGWTGAGNPEGTLYKVLSSTAPDPANPAGAVVSSSYTYSLSLSSSGLSADTTYYFRAAAVNANGAASAYTAPAGTATLLGYPPLFSNFTNVAAGAAQFNWSANGDAYPGTLYRVLSSTAPDPANPAGAVVASSYTYNLSLSSSGLAADTTYYLRVAGVNKNGVSTAYTVPAGTATLLAYPPLPAGFTGVTGSGVQFNWSANGDAYPGTLFKVVSSTAPDPLNPGGAVALSSYTYGLSLSSQGLAGNTTYYFRAAGVNKNWVPTAYTAVSATSTLANAPSGLYSTGVTTQAAQVNWAGGSNGPGTLYYVLVSTAPDPLLPSGAAVTSAYTYNLYVSTAGLEPFTYYYFRVSAFNNNGVQTAWSDPPFEVQTLATGQIGSPAAGSITGVFVSSMSASWDLVSGATGYTLAASLAPDNPPAAIAASSTTINGESHADLSGLTPDTSYYLFVRANGQGTSGVWLAYPHRATLLAYPPAFSGFSEVYASSGVFSWSANGNAYPGTLFRVLVSTSPDPLSPGGAAVSSSDTYGLSLSASGLAADTTYYFRAAGVNKDGVLTNYTVPQATATWANTPLPSGFSGVGAAAMQFNWSANGDRVPGTLYRVLVSSAPDPLNPGGATVTSSDTYGLSLSASGLSADTTYYFRAAALGVSGVASAYSAAQGTATLVAYPPLPAGFTNVTETALQFNWSANGDRDPGTLYHVLASTAPDPLNPSGAVVASSFTYNRYLASAALVPNTTRYFTVAAVNRNGVETSYTEVADTSTLATPPLTALSTFSAVTSQGFTAAWSPNSNPAGTVYQVQASTASDFNSGVYAQVTASTAPLQGTSYAFSGLLSSSVYYFRLRAQNNNDVYTAYAQLGSTTTLRLPAPVPAQVTQVSTYSMTASWSLVGGATGYLLAASVNSASPPSPVYASSETSAAQASVYQPALALNTTYFLFVRAEGPGDASDWAVYPPTSTLVNQPAVPGAVFGAVTDNGFSVSWDANSNPLGSTLYQVQVSTASDFNFGATDQISFSTAPVYGPGAAFSGLSSNTYYYARVRAANNNGSYTAWTGLGYVKTLILPVLHSAGDGVLLYGRAGSSAPQFRNYYSASNAFSPVQATLSGVSGSLFVIKTDPLTTKQEAVAGYVANGTLHVLCSDGANWEEEWTQYVGGDASTRRFDIAYESNSGDAVVLYSHNASGSSQLGYRVKSGAAGCGPAGWSADASLSPLNTAGIVQWVKLASDPRADQNDIAAIWADNASRLDAMVWNGSSWEDEPSQPLETSLEAVSAAQDVEDFAVQYEATTGNIMVVWANSAGGSGTNGVRYARAVWTGGTPLHTWSAPAMPPTFTDDATNLTLAANPASSEMVFASIGNSRGYLQAGYWNGSAWTDTAGLVTTAQIPQAGTRLVAAAWLSSGTVTRSVITYDNANSTTLGWITGSGGTFTKQTAFSPTPAFASPQVRYSMRQDPVNRDRAIAAVADSNYDLFGKRVIMNSAGTFTWSNADGGAALETSLSSAAVAGDSFEFWPAPPTTTFDQSAYRVFADSDSTDVGAPLAAQDTLATLPSAGSAFRLRQLVDIGNVDLPLNSQGFRLQFAGMGDGTCAAPSNGTPAAYTDVTSTTALAFNNNPSVADNTPLTADANDPRYGTHITIDQTYVEQNNSTNTVAAIPRGEDGMWDFSLKDNGLTPGAVYCLRLVKDTGVQLEGYTVYPQVLVPAPVQINEVYPTGAAAADDWVELYNNTSSTPSLAGWKLNYVESTIDIGGSANTLWTGQAGAVINAYSTFTITNLPVALNGAQSYYVNLVNPAGAAADQVQWPGPGVMSLGESFARITDGNPYFEIDPTPTRGYSNSVSTDSLLINEVGYSAGRQFVELYNSSPVSTRTLAGYSLRDSVSSQNGAVFRFTRKIYPLDYALLDYSSVGDDGKTFTDVFGAAGPSPAGDFLALENSTGSTVDMVTWQSGTAYSRYNYKGALTDYPAHAPAGAATSIARGPTEGADTGNDAADFYVSAFVTPASRNNGAGAAAPDTLYLPGDNSAPRYLSRRFGLSLALGAASSGGGNNIVFERTGGSADLHSPHLYRLADIGFDLSALTRQTTVQAGYAFYDQDGSPLVSSASYRMIVNSSTGTASAPPIVLDTVTYDASVQAVTASTDAPRWMNDAFRAAVIRLDVSNNSPAGFNPIELATVTFRLLDPALNPLTQAAARSLFNAVMLVRDSNGYAGVYEPALDVTTAAYVPMNAISVDALGFSTLTVSQQYLSEASVPAASTSTFFLVLESTAGASAASPDTFLASLSPASAVVADAPDLLAQDFAPSADVQTGSVTLIAPALPPTGSTWPYITPSSAAINTMATSYDGISLSPRIYSASTDGHLRALAPGGLLLWDFATSPLSPINSNPTDAGTAGDIYFADDAGDVYKLQDNGTSASLVWKRSLGVQIRSGLIDSGTSLYFGASDNTMHCIDKTSASGAVCSGWIDLPVSGAVSNTPLVDNRTGVNASWIGTESGALVEFRNGTGGQVASASLGATIYSSPFGDVASVSPTNKLYITSSDGYLYAVPLDLGSANHVYPPAQAGAPSHSSPFLWPVMDNGERFVYYGDDSGLLHKVSTQTWTEPSGWPFQAGGAIRTSPVVVPASFAGLPAGQDYVYFGCDDGYIYAVNINTGQLKTGWPVATGGPVRADPVFDGDNDTISVGSSDGRVYAVYVGP